MKPELKFLEKLLPSPDLETLLTYLFHMLWVTQMYEKIDFFDRFVMSLMFPSSSKYNRKKILQYR